MIGERIRVRRVILRLSQRELADAVGVSTNTIGSWERGDTSPRIHRLPILAKALGCTVLSLIDSSGDAGWMVAG